MSNTFEWVSIRCDAALRLVERAVERARQQGLAVCVAVVDPRGTLKAFANMDGAPQIAVEACRAKANAALMGLGSAELAQAVSNQPAVLASLVAQPEIALLGGGLPLLEEGRVVGAIGVGGALTEQDIDIAEWARQGL